MSDRPTEHGPGHAARPGSVADPAGPVADPATAGAPEAADAGAPEPAGAGSPSVAHPAGVTGATAPRPLSRRELRRGGPAPTGAEPHAGRPGAVRRAAPAAAPVDVPPDAADAVPADPGGRMAHTVPSDTSRYAPAHYLVLAAVACVLGYLIWSLATGAAEADASSVGAAVPITSPSAPLTATQGEL